MTTIEERWRTKVVEDGACLVWTGATTKDGYGRINVGNRQIANVHRWVYEAFVEPIPDGLQIDHLCRNRACCLPSHLEPVTHAENMQRGVGYLGRSTWTQCVHGHEFTPENTYYGNGRRSCRTCNRARTAKWRAQKEG